MTKSSLAKFLVIMASFSLLFGFGVGGFFLREPDTCFLLATGRWICEHQTLPNTDPFSYTAALYPQPLGLVAYQWLSEIIFFRIHELSGSQGLGVLACLVLVNSFFIVPWLILNSFHLGALRAGIIIVWMAFGTIDRLLLKPEIFSYLFLSLFILVAVKGELSKRSPFMNWKRMILLGAMMLLWANLHTGFVIGIVFTLLLALRDLILGFYDKFFKTNKYGNYSPSWLISFLVCLFASLSTPYGLTLWKYIPHLYFHPVNQYIIELRPLSFSMVFYNFPLLISFFGLSALAVLQILRKLRKPLSKSDFFYILIAVVGIVLAIDCLRMVTFALLLMLPIIASGFRIKDNADPLNRFAVAKIPALVLSFALVGCLTMCFLGNPTIPITTKSFAAPFSAIKYLSKHKLSGNLLNDPGFGDVLIWNMLRPPLVFIDTRFDAYPWTITENYLTLRDCKTGWHGLLEKYKINCIFMPAASKLCTELNKDEKWQTAYRDEISQILVTKVSN